MIKKTAIAVCVCAIVTQTVQAEDLLEIYQLAVQNDPQLSQAESNYRSVGETERQAFGSFLPTVNASFNYSDSTGSSSTVDGQNFESDNQVETLRVTLDQTIYDHSNYTRLDASRARTAQAEADLLAARQDLMIRVAERYLSVLTNKDAFTFTEAEEKANERQLEQAEQRYEVGLTAITDVHEARASYDQSRARAIVAKNTLDDSYEALNEITGVYTENLKVVREKVNFPPPMPANPDTWVEQAMNANPSVLSSKFASDAAFHNIRTERAGHLPSLSANASYRDTTNDGDLGPFATTNSDDTSFGFTVSVPIYAGGNVNSRTRQAQYDHESAMQRLEQDQRSVTRATRNNYRAIIAGISEVEAFRQSVISAQSALEATEAGFEVGTRTIVDVLLAQRSLFQAQRDYSGARHDLLLDELRLQASAGQITVDDLKKVNSILE